MTPTKILLLFQLIKIKLTNFGLNLTNYTNECNVNPNSKTKLYLKNNVNSYKTSSFIEFSISFFSS